MKNLLGAMMLMFCFTISASCDATVETYDPETGTGTIGPGGCVDR